MILGLSVQLEAPLPRHSHNAHELIVSGGDGGELVVGDTHFGFRTGQTVFVDSGREHAIHVSESRPTQSHVICFDDSWARRHLAGDVVDLLDTLGRAQCHGSEVDATTAGENIVLWQRMEAELSKGDAYGHAVVAGLLSQLLVHHYRGGHSGGDKPSVDPRIQASVDWMRDNLDKAIDLETMAKRARMSRASFSKYFRASTGTSMVKFLTTARLERAARMLVRDDESVAGVAYGCGFRNLGHFHETFKRELRMTPAQYRSMAREQGARSA